MDGGQNEDTPTYTNRPTWRWLLLIVLIAIVILGGGYYLLMKNGSYQLLGISQNQRQVSPTAQSSPAVIMNTSSGTSSAKQQFTVSGSEFAFSPAKLTVNKGDMVEITFKNDGKFPHNLTITDLGVATKTIQPGEEDTISFAADKVGSYQFLCTVPGHADRGMIGTFIVK